LAHGASVETGLHENCLKQIRSTTKGILQIRRGAVYPDIMRMDTKHGLPAFWQSCRPETVILANGAFPTHPIPLDALDHAKRVVCCDGATTNLTKHGRKPDAIVGDLDSLPESCRRHMGSRVHHDAGQDDNDLAKAFRFCVKQGWRNCVIVGASGLREDHLLGNLGLLVDFAKLAEVALLTDSGVFYPVLKTCELKSFKKQAISLFTFDRKTAVTVDGVRYPVNGAHLMRWWQATLNESTGSSIAVRTQSGPALVFQAYRNI